MLELRYFEIRQEGERRLTGTAVRYGDTAALPWGGTERIEAGAFQPIGDVILNASHDRGRPLARTGAGLELVDGRDALRMTATLPETREAAGYPRACKGGNHEGPVHRIPGRGGAFRRRGSGDRARRAGGDSRCR